MQTDGGGSLGLVQAALLVVVAFVCLFVLLRDTTWSTWLWSLWGGSRTGSSSSRTGSSSSSSSSSAKEEAHNNVSKKKETTTADDASSDGEEKDEPEGVSAAAALDSGMTGSSLQPTFVDPSRQGMISGAAARSSSSSAAPSPVAPFPVARPPAPGLWTPAAASLFAGSATGAGTSRQIGLTHSGHAAAVAAASVADDGVSAFSRFQPTAYAH